MPHKLIEKESVERVYGFAGINAIIENEKGERFFICDGYCGEDTLDGGAVRFKGGLMIRLKKSDNLRTLNTPICHYSPDSILSLILTGYEYNEERPILNWHGFIIEKIARSVGLIGC